MASTSDLSEPYLTLIALGPLLFFIQVLDQLYCSLEATFGVHLG